MTRISQRETEADERINNVHGQMRVKYREKPFLFVNFKGQVCNQ